MGTPEPQKHMNFYSKSLTDCWRMWKRVLLLWVIVHLLSMMASQKKGFETPLKHQIVKHYLVFQGKAVFIKSSLL